MLQFSHPNTFWLFPAFLQSSVLPRLGFASKYMKNNLNIFIIQCCAKEMTANFAEINKLRTFVSDENSAKFRRIYCSSPYEISEATCIKVSCTVQWNYQLTKQNWFVRQELGCYWARKSTGPFEERGPGPETVDSFFRYYHVKHGSLGSTVFRYLNAEIPLQ